MRDIKFRAWDKVVKNMVPIKTIDFGKDGAECAVDFCDINGDLTGKNPEWVLMQSTGMKDKNGVEIYEGDVLFHPLQGRRKVFYPYSETVASYGLRNIDNGFGSTLQDSNAVWEVIGNIYESPELLGWQA